MQYTEIKKMGNNKIMPILNFMLYVIEIIEEIKKMRKKNYQKRLKCDFLMFKIKM